MQHRLAKTLVVLLTGFGLFAASLNANARAIRFDGEGGTWTDPVLTDTGLSTLVSNIGFTFNFFGTSTVSLTIHANGTVSFGGALIAPFLDDTQSLSYTYSTTTAPPDLGGNIPSAIRINWFSEADFDNENQFQLAIFDLGDGNFAMEFNYAQIVNGSDGTSSIGYDNGAGESFDLLAALGDLEGFGGPLPFSEYSGIGADGLDANDEFFDPNNLLCADSARILACNNYNAVTNQFDSVETILPPGFNEFFQVDPSFLTPTQGRYYFLIDNGGGTPVPEPGTLWLLSIGLVGLAISCRRRRTVSYIS